MAGNQTQTDVEFAARKAVSDFCDPGPRTLDRLYELADARAERKNLPVVIVRSTALRMVRERVPDALPLPQAGAPPLLA